ncbi:MAG: aromatic amino acid DMT transporter YddG [Rhodocyclaceae bacterium]
MQAHGIASKKATLIGVVAILLWSSMIGLIRSVSEILGPLGGAAVTYTIAAILLFITVGLPDLRRIPRLYLVIGGALFVACETCLSLSIGKAQNGRQVIEVGMVNYLWPSLTMTFAILFNGRKSSFLIAPGLALAVLGTFWILGGDQGFALDEMLDNIRTNPVSYGLALGAALNWAAYCSVTSGIAKGANGITLFMILTALTLWTIYLVGDGPAMRFNYHVIAYVLMAATAMGFGYVAWNIGILHGNVTVLAGASYFTPVLSSTFSAVLLRAPLSLAFWQGAFMVSAGSTLCWWATREKPTKVRGQVN